MAGDGGGEDGDDGWGGWGGIEGQNVELPEITVQSQFGVSDPSGTGLGLGASVGYADAGGGSNNASAMGAAGYGSNYGAPNSFGWESSDAAASITDPQDVPGSFLAYMGQSSPSDLDIGALGFYNAAQAQANAYADLEARGQSPTSILGRTTLAQAPTQLPPIVIKSRPYSVPRSSFSRVRDYSAPVNDPNEPGVTGFVADPNQSPSPSFRGAANPGGFQGPLGNAVRGLGQFAVDVNRALGTTGSPSFQDRFGSVAQRGPDLNNFFMVPASVRNAGFIDPFTSRFPAPQQQNPRLSYVQTSPVRGLPRGPQLPGPAVQDFPPTRSRAPTQISVTPSRFAPGPSAPAPQAPQAPMDPTDVMGGVASGPWDEGWVPYFDDRSGTAYS